MAYDLLFEAVNIGPVVNMLTPDDAMAASTIP